MLKKFILLMLAISFLACNRNEGPVQSIDELQQRLAKINDMTQQVEVKRENLYAQIRDFNSGRPDSAQFDVAALDTLLGSTEKELLRAMFNEEKDISYRGLLKTIVAKNDEIAGLQNQITELRSQLPKPYVVQPGDTHYEVVLNYLVREHGLSEQEALKVAWRTSLIDEILPGNDIWLMYKDGVVGSFVSQGTATVAPMTVQVRAKQKLLQRAAMAEAAMKQDSLGVNR